MRKGRDRMSNLKENKRANKVGAPVESSIISKENNAAWEREITKLHGVSLSSLGETNWLAEKEIMRQWFA